ncbi:transposase (plasmid) [Polaromonas sp. P1-6]|nr:transposase [Polaromonas sp. P1-6]
MKIMHTMASEANANRPTRRFYSAELKTQVMQECRQGGASVAGVALSHGINANIVHRWLREHTPRLRWWFSRRRSCPSHSMNQRQAPRHSRRPTFGCRCSTAGAPLS